MPGSALAMVRAVKLSRGALLALLALLLFTLSGGTSAPADGVFLHPALLALAAEHPAQTVNVIVQKSTPNDHLERTVAALGGQVTSDLWIIHGFAAQMRAATLPQLASAGGVRWISPDGLTQDTSGPGDRISTANLANTYIKTIGADKVWNGAGYLQGQGIGVAVMDSGISANADFSNLVAASSTSGALLSFNETEKDVADNYGHGTHVAGIIAGNGTNSNGMYIGVAPKATLYNLKIANKRGQGTTSGMLLASEWLLLNHTKFNIRVVNMSFSSAVAQSYHVDPIDVAVELLWMNGVVVVAAVGNKGPNGLMTAPANDPYAIAVGATDDKGTAPAGDDTLALFSSFGKIENGIDKPDLVAPGRHIVSVLASAGATLAGHHSSNILATNGNYFVMSGTSMASPVVAGAAALLLQAHPTLTPDQVKGCLIAKAANPVPGASTKYVKVYDIGSWDCSGATSNRGVPPSRLMVQVLAQLLAGELDLDDGTGNNNWGPVNRGSTIKGNVNRGNVNWGNVNWGDVNWGNVNWGNVNWGNVNWGNVNWGNVNWGNVNWGNVNWGDVEWDN